MAAQFLSGDQGVQIRGAQNSTFTITYSGVTRAVPLERAAVSPPAGTKSPARLLRARAAFVPFSARESLRDALNAWRDSGVPFAGAVIGGGGGTGKTRLAVELCEQAEGEGWLTGLLTPIEDQASLEALAEAPVPRLIAVDYAESRAAQMKLLLPLLASRATLESPVRVLLLVRAGPKRTTDWAEALRNQSDLLDNLLDECEMHVLEESPLQPEERAGLFEAAAETLADRLDVEVPDPPSDLQRSPAFASPLLVVLAAYLAAERDETPSTREELLRAVLLHEERYWRSSSGDLFADEEQPRRVVALITLLSAEREAEASELLRILPDFSDSPAERVGLIARWARSQYPGGGWWNPLEPDLIGEQLVADVLSEQPAVLARVLARETPRQLIRPLEVLGRAGGSHSRLAAALAPILGVELERLCRLAVSQAREEADHNLLYGKAVTLAAVLEKAIAAVEVDRAHLIAALQAMPRRFDLVLNPLALALTLRLVEHERRLAAANPTAFEPSLAMTLNNLSVRLSDAGRREEALAPSEEATEIYRRLTATDPTAFEPSLAIALNNLSLRLADAGRREEALAPGEEATEIYRRLTAANAAAFEPDLAAALNNFSNRLAEAGHHDKALAASEEAVEIRRRLAAADPRAFEPDLASSLNNLSNRLSDVGRREEALAPSEEATEIYRRLTAANAAAFEPNLAAALNNLSLRLADAGRREKALAASREAVEIRRRLAATNPAAFEHGLAIALNNLSNQLADAGRREEALAASEEAVEIRRSLASTNPAAFEPYLAAALNNLSNQLAEAGRREEALEPSEESMEMYRRLTAANAAAFEPELAMALNNLSNRLSEAGRREEALEPSEESMEIYRRLTAANAAAFEPKLAMALNNLSNRLAEVGRYEEALAPGKESMEIYRRLTAANAAAFESDLALALNNLSNRLAEAGHHENALAASKEAVGIRRRLTAANAAAFEASLATALNNLSNRLAALGHHKEAQIARSEAEG